MKSRSAAARAIVDGAGTVEAPRHAMPGVDRMAMGQALRASGGGHQAAPSRIDAHVPPGVHDQSMNAVAPFLGTHALPTGQQINVSMNAPSPHLPFKEWVARGVVAGIGHAAAWPFRLVAGLVDHAARTVISILGKLAMFVLLPAALILGIQMAKRMAHSATVETGAAQIVHDGRHAAHGAFSGATDDLPAEKPDLDDAPTPRRHHPRGAE